MQSHSATPSMKPLTDVQTVDKYLHKKKIWPLRQIVIAFKSCHGKRLSIIMHKESGASKAQP